MAAEISELGSGAHTADPSVSGATHAISANREGNQKPGQDCIGKRDYPGPSCRYL